MTDSLAASELPDNQAMAAAYGALAGIYDEAGECGEAEVFYRRALVVDPAAVGLHVRLALTLIALNRPDEAEGHLRRALVLDPSSAAATHVLAELYAEQGRTGEAAAAYRDALGHGDEAGTHAAYADLMFGLGALGEAESHYRVALRLPEPPAEAGAHLGLLLVRTGRTDEAEPLLRAAADELGCAASLTNHGNALAALGRSEEAGRRYRAALGADPACAEAHWGLSQVGGGEQERERALELRPRLALRCAD